MDVKAGMALSARYLSTAEHSDDSQRLSQLRQTNLMSSARSKARRLAVQALYQWQLAGHDINDIETQFLDEMPVRKVDVVYFKDILHGVPARIDALDTAIMPYLDRPMDEVDPVERAILRLATYELSERIDVPYRVVINEAVELAKVFGAEQSHRYINGVLDKVAAKLRAVEVAAKDRGTAT